MIGQVLHHNAYSYIKMKLFPWQFQHRNWNEYFLRLDQTFWYACVLEGRGNLSICYCWWSLDRHHNVGYAMIDNYLGHWHLLSKFILNCQVSLYTRISQARNKCKINKHFVAIQPTYRGALKVTLVLWWITYIWCTWLKY